MSAIATPTAPAVPNTPPVGGPRPWHCTREQYEKLCQAGFFLEHRYQLIRGEIIDTGEQGPRHLTYSPGDAVTPLHAANPVTVAELLP
jgi:hypothetical protein